MTAPKTRVQQMIDKTLNSNLPMTSEEELLDRRSGLYSALMQEDDATGRHEVLNLTVYMAREEGMDVKKEITLPVIAAAISLAEKATPADVNAFTAKAIDLGVAPASLKGESVLAQAEIMERDLDIPALEKQLRTFGYTLENGTVGAWALPGARRPAPPRTGM